MLYFKLDNIKHDQFWMKVIKDLQHSLSKQDNIENKILVMKLQEVTRDDSTMIPKLEHKNL